MYEESDIRKELMLKSVHSLVNKITPMTKDALLDEFLALKVYQSPALNEVTSIIHDKAIEKPEFGPLISLLCNRQVNEELKLNNNVSHFRNAILSRVQETFMTKDLGDVVVEKQAEIDAEADEKKKKEKQKELLEMQSKFSKRKLGNVMFIGQLYLQGIFSIRIIHFCVVDLLKSVGYTEPGHVKAGEPDEESIECAVRLLESIGKRITEQNIIVSKEAAAKAGLPKDIQPPFPLDLTFSTLEGCIPIVSSRIKCMIMNLVELRKNGWVPMVIDEERAMATLTSILATSTKISLSSVTYESSEKCSEGVNGGENSEKEDRADAIQQTSRFMQQCSSSAASMEEEGASASDTAAQAKSDRL